MSDDPSSSASLREPLPLPHEHARPRGRAARSPLRPVAVPAAVLLLVFAWPLLALAAFALQSSLYSYVLLVPLVSGYFVWLRRSELPAQTRPDRLVGTLAAGMAAGLAAWGVAERVSHAPGWTEAALAATALAFVFGLVAVGAFTLGRPLVRALAFPLGFLVFLAPMPEGLAATVEEFLQHGSATVAHQLFHLSGMPVFRQELVFVLPGFSMEVARECSGIRSSLALLITSVVAGQMFLRTPWKRVVLTAAVVPLALLRNGFRVFVLGELCVNVDPALIDSFIHHQGGPIFFALSLIPFGGLLYFLARSDRRRRPAGVSSP